MLTRIVGLQDATHLLDLPGASELESAAEAGEVQTADGSSKDFIINDLVIFKLSQVLHHAGVEKAKAFRYAEAILGSRLQVNQENLVEWVENEKQDLFCLIADSQLARIFLRNKDDLKELDVGAIKPVLLPITRCEINVFRVIRPVIMRAQQLFSEK